MTKSTRCTGPARRPIPDRLIENWMNSRGYKTLDRWRGNVRLAVYVMPASGRARRDGPEPRRLSLGSDITVARLSGLEPGARRRRSDPAQAALARHSARPERRYKIFLQLLDANDQVIAQRDAEPAGESRPTNTWEPGEIDRGQPRAADPARHPSRHLPAHRRHVRSRDQRAPAASRTARTTSACRRSRVERSPIPPSLAALDMQYTQSFEFGGISLLGHDRYKRGFGHAPDTPLNPGDLLHMTFYWQANMRATGRLVVQPGAQRRSGPHGGQLQAPLVSETYGTTLWQNGEVVRGEHDLLIPDRSAARTLPAEPDLLPDSDTHGGQSASLGTVTCFGADPEVTCDV